MKRVLVLIALCVALVSGTHAVQAVQVDSLSAGDFSVTVAPGGTASFDLNALVTGGVQPYKFAVQNQPLFAIAILDRDGKLVIEAEEGATGSDFFIYVVTDSAPDAASAQSVTTGEIAIVYAEPTGDPVPTDTPATPVAGTDDDDPVVQLPSTGSGTGAGTSVVMVLIASLALAASAFGFRRKLIQ